MHSLPQLQCDVVAAICWVCLILAAAAGQIMGFVCMAAADEPICLSRSAVALCMLGLAAAEHM